MKNNLLLFCLASVLMCKSVFGQDTNILSTVSPKLRQFLVEQPMALSILTNCLTEAFSKRTFQLYYFYTEDELQSRASHYYPAESVVGVVIRENQQPFDEFLCLVFEILNSKNENSYSGLCEKAESGKVSKADFVLEMQRIEFNTTLRMRNFTKQLKITSVDESQSYFLKRLKDCPDSFVEFLTYRKKISPDRDAAIKAHYETQYDKLNSGR